MLFLHSKYFRTLYSSQIKTSQQPNHPLRSDAKTRASTQRTGKHPEEMYLNTQHVIALTEKEKRTFTGQPLHIPDTYPFTLCR
jgi:hypothetical protein